MKKLKTIKLKISLKQAAFFSAFAILFLFNCFLLCQINALKKELKIEMDVTSQNYDQNLDVFEKHVDEMFVTLSTQISELSENQSDEISGVKRNLSKMNSTYGSILEEEKKQRIDVSSRDNEIISIKNEAIQNYLKGNFKLSYTGFKKVLSYIDNDLESRLYKMKSLFKSNKGNKAAYQEILKDLEILKLNGRADDESLEIEKVIKLELDGLNG